MRKLHLVGLTTDRDGLIFTARKGSKSGGFIVPLDDRVLAAIAEARGAPNGAPEVQAEVADLEVVPKRLRSQSALTPREMQARLRAGRSIDEVASEAGVDTEWVARFAVPILAEQAQVVELARSLVYAKPRLGESSQPLGASVMQNLSDRGIFIPDDVAQAAWSAFQLHDSVWMVRFRYRSRGRDQEAQWEIDVPAGRLLARNRHASDLGYVDPRRRHREVEVDEDPAENDAEVVVPKRSSRPAAKAEPVAKAPAKRRAAPRAAVRVTPGRPPTRRPPPRTVSKAAHPTGKRKAGTTAKAPAPAKRAAAPPRSRVKAAAPKATRSTAKSAAAKSSAAKSPAGKSAAAKSSAAKSSARTRVVKAAAPARSPSRRRPAKAAPAADAGPTGGTRGVRMAVQQVSTARMAASMAAADREPWAAAVRRPAPGARADSRTNGDRTGRPARPSPSTPRPRVPTVPAPPVADRHDRTDEQPAVPAFEPRPLPPDGGRAEVPARVRRVTTTRQPSPTDGPPTMSLPSRRGPAAKESLPGERPKRRRLRSR